MSAPSQADVLATLKTALSSGTYPGLAMALVDAIATVLHEHAAQYIDPSSEPIGKKGTSSSYFNLGAGYTADTARAVGLVTNVDPTSVTTAIQAGGFVAGVADTSNPTVEVASTDGLAGGDIIQVSGSKTNDGFYEVMGVLAAPARVRVKGVGTTTTTEKWTGTQFTAEAGDGAVTKVAVSVLRAGTSLVWEMGFGSTAPLTYSNIGRTSDAPSGVLAKDHDPANTQYNFGTTTALKTYDVGELGQIIITGYQLPARGHADLKTRLKIEYQNGSSTVIENATDATKEDSFLKVANIIHGDATIGEAASNDGNRVRKVVFEVQNISVDTDRTVDLGVFRVRGFMVGAGSGAVTITP